MRALAGSPDPDPAVGGAGKRAAAPRAYIPTRRLIGLVCLAGLAGLGSWAPAAPLDVAVAQAPESYFPGPGDDWERRAPADVGMDAELLQQAVTYAVDNETSMPRDPRRYLQERFAGVPHQEIVGPTRERGDSNGLVLRHGYIVAEWGDTRRVDMTFSVTKSFLATTAGLALDRGLIADVHDRVAAYVETDHFGSRQNAPITWHHLLQQTSEWEGELWGKPDTADRRRGIDRRLHEPGSFWEYNDVRVNLTAYALLQVWRRPLPEVLDQLVMDPIGASDTWQWHGYRTSWTELDGERVQSVSGGGHWGGGMWIGSRDLARFGYLYLRRGLWDGRRVLSEAWIDAAIEPSDIQPQYGYMWWVNSDGTLLPSAPRSAFAALGGGDNMVYVDPEHDLVAVVRWLDRREGENVRDEFVGRLLAAIRPDGS